MRANETRFNDEGTEVPVAPELRETLTAHFSNRRGELSAQNIGDFLSKYQRRVECGGRFEIQGHYGARKLWQLVVVDQSSLDEELRKFLNLSQQASQASQASKF